MSENNKSGGVNHNSSKMDESCIVPTLMLESNTKPDIPDSNVLVLNNSGGPNYMQDDQTDLLPTPSIENPNNLLTSVMKENNKNLDGRSIEVFHNPPEASPCTTSDSGWTDILKQEADSVSSNLNSSNAPATTCLSVLLPAPTCLSLLLPAPTCLSMSPNNASDKFLAVDDKFEKPVIDHPNTHQAVLPSASVSVHSSLKSNFEDFEADVIEDYSLHKELLSLSCKMPSANCDANESQSEMEKESQSKMEIHTKESTDSLASEDSLRFNDSVDKQEENSLNYSPSILPITFDLDAHSVDNTEKNSTFEREKRIEKESSNFPSHKYLSSCSLESSSDVVTALISESEDDSYSTNNVIKSDAISNLEFSSGEGTQLNSCSLTAVQLSSPKTSESVSYNTDNSNTSGSNSEEAVILEFSSSKTCEFTSENARSSSVSKISANKPELCSLDADNFECSSGLSKSQGDNKSDFEAVNQCKLKSDLDGQKLEFNLQMLMDTEITENNINSDLNPGGSDGLMSVSEMVSTLSDIKSDPGGKLESESVLNLKSLTESIGCDTEIKKEIKLKSEECLASESKSSSEITTELSKSNSHLTLEHKIKAEITFSNIHMEKTTRPEALLEVKVKPDPEINNTLGCSEKGPNSVMLVHSEFDSKNVLEFDSISEVPIQCCPKLESDAENINELKYSPQISDLLENTEIKKWSKIKEFEIKPVLLLKKKKKTEIKSEQFSQDAAMSPKISEVKNEQPSQDAALPPVKKVTEISEHISEDDFDWDSYLEETSSEAAPPTAFLHVERSLETGVKEGQCLEVLQPFNEMKMDDDDLEDPLKEKECWASFWPAKVVSSCGNLLRVRFLGFSSAKSSTALEFWRDLSSRNIKPLCWSSARGIPMQLPSSLCSLPESLNINIENELASLESIPEEVFCESTREIFARIRGGNLLEVLDSECPREGRVVEVKRNHGGRLLLEDVVEAASDVFWMFFLDPRIKPFGWINKQEHFRYQNAEYLQFLENEACVDNHPSLSFLELFQNLPRKHLLEIGMYLEAIMPTTLQSVHVAVVSSIVNETHFELTIEDHRWVTTIEDPLLLPCNFCRDHFLDLIFPEDTKNNFKWEEYLSSVGGKMTPADLFSEHVLGSEVGFEEGHKIEAVSPLDPTKIGIATIERIVGHLLLLKLDANPSSLFYRPASSMDIFPAGWAQSNGLSLGIPSLFAPQERDVRADQRGYLAVPSEETAFASADREKSGKVNNSMWCPKLYINHFCYPGPYLSKSKVAKMSQSVGPGPVALVLRDVIGMTINSGYIPTRVLRELQNLPMKNLLWQAVPLKAKFKRHTLKASVNIPSTARELGTFLMEFSKILMSCPNLWSHEPIGENCPHVCNRQNLSSIPSGAVVFRGRGIRGYSWRKKRGGKKRLFYPIKNSATSQDDSADRVSREGDEEDFCEPDDGFDGEEGLSGSEGESRPSSPPCSEGPRKLKQKRMLSALEITMNESRVLDLTRDRGAKRTRVESDPPSQRLQGAFEGSPSRRNRARPEDEPPNAIYGLEPADVASDPLEWSVADVERYVASQPAIGHHAVRLREHEVDGRALLLLNLPSLVHHLRLPHGAAVALAQYICKVKMAHFLFFHPDRGQRR